MSDGSMAFSREIRKAAGVGHSPMGELAAARERIEKARASGDAAEIEAATIDPVGSRRRTPLSAQEWIQHRALVLVCGDT